MNHIFDGRASEDCILLHVMGEFQPKEGKSSALEKINRRNFQEKLKISKKKFASFLDSQVENKTVGEPVR